MQLYISKCFQCDAHFVRFVPFERTHKKVAASNTDGGKTAGNWLYAWMVMFLISPSWGLIFIPMF